MSFPPARFSWLAVSSALVLLAMVVTPFFLPLKPTAWGGPRDAGPFEIAPTPDGILDSWSLTKVDDRWFDGGRPHSGRWSRDARLALERFAKLRSPDTSLEATGEALLGFHSLLIAGRWLVLWLILYRMSRVAWLATLFTLLSAMPTFLGAPRHTETDVGLFLFTLLLAATACRRPPWWLAAIALPALFALWANAHSSTLIGLSWLAIVTLGRAIEWWKAEDDADRPHLLRYFVATSLSVVAISLNPDGVRIYFDGFAAMKNTNLFALSAWQPLDIRSEPDMPWFFFGTMVLLLLTQIVSSRPFSPTLLIIVLSFGLWPTVQARGLDYWWLIVPWLLGPEIAKCGCAHPLPVSFPGRMKWVVSAVCGIALLVTPLGRWLMTGTPRSTVTIASRDTPVRLAGELAGTEAWPEFHETVHVFPQGKYRGAVLCGEEQGDYLAWVLDGDNNQPPMLYTRPETMDPDHWNECRRVLDGNGDWWEITSRHQTNLICIDPRRHGKLADRLRNAKEWHTVQDDALLIAVRREPRLPADMMKPDR